MSGTHRRPPAPVLVALILPIALAVTVAAIGIATKLHGIDEEGRIPAETGPLAVAPVDAPGATTPDCATLIAALPAELSSLDGPLPQRPLAEPAPAGVHAWAASPRPVVLRCGLPRPAELTPTSPLVEVDGVRWLELTDGLPQPQMVTYVAVDRPVYVALTTPTDLGTGPIQQVSAAVSATLPATAVSTR